MENPYSILLNRLLVVNCRKNLLHDYTSPRFHLLGLSLGSESSLGWNMLSIRSLERCATTDPTNSLVRRPIICSLLTKRARLRKVERLRTSHACRLEMNRPRRYGQLQKSVRQDCCDSSTASWDCPQHGVTYDEVKSSAVIDCSIDDNRSLWYF